MNALNTISALALSATRRLITPLALAALAMQTEAWAAGSGPAVKAESPNIIGLTLAVANDELQAIKAEEAKVPPPGQIIKDCPDCPELMVIPAGSFEMGSTKGESSEKPLHHVTLAKPFAIGKYEVTQAQWQAVMGSNPSHFSNCGPGCPVENVSWYDVQKFIKRLNQKTGKSYRLPTEAEWEYACRAGQQSEYCGGNDAGKVGWYSDNSGNKTHPVGQKQTNAFGLYDMSGNVFEWLADGYHKNYIGAPTDGSKWPDEGNTKTPMARGGSWSHWKEKMRSTNRAQFVPEMHLRYVGFRLATTLP